MSRGHSSQRLEPFRLRVPPRPARPPRTYPVDPQAHANLRSILKEREQGESNAAANTAKETAAMTDYSELFTEDVVARWWRLFQRGKSLNWIAKNNGLHKTSGNTVKQYLVRYGYLSGDEDLRQHARDAAADEPRPQPVVVAVATARAPLPRTPAPAARPGAIMHTVAGDAAGLEEQLLAIQQIMSTVRAQDVAISGKITLQLNVEIAV